MTTVDRLDVNMRAALWARRIALENPPEPTPWGDHKPVWVQQDGPDEFLLECSCGGTFRRSRLADAAVAHERHQQEPGRYWPDMTAKAAP